MENRLILLRGENEVLKKIIESDGEAYNRLKDENEALASALNDARKEIHILNNNIERMKNNARYRP